MNQGKTRMPADSKITVDSKIICPVCRAKQDRQPDCRRCGADLRLYLKAILSNELAQRDYAQATTPDRIAQIEEYLNWLRPGELSRSTDERYST